MRFTERPIKCFFSFFCCYSYSLSSAIPYNRPNLHSYHHERIPPFQFTVILMFTILSAVHILHYLFAIYTAGVHVRGNASNDASNPRPPSPRSVCMHFFSKLVTSHASLSCIIEEKILLTAGLATQSLKLSFID